MKFVQILDKYRKIAFSERDKGARFERLIQAYLQTDPIYANQLKHVWLWQEFPYVKDFGGKDTGIDLVAQTHSGDYWAIQCKCFAEDTYIDKPAVDSFLATSSRSFTNENLQTTTFSYRLWVSTTNKWGSNAEEAICNQSPPLSRISLKTLEESSVDWEALDKGISGSKALEKKKTPMEHQKTAIHNFHEHFKHADRGQLIMACGTGKTFTSLKIAEKETDGKGLVLFLVPSIALLGQTLREWSAQADEPIIPICICSDTEVSKKKSKSDDIDGYSVEDLALPASTNVPSIIKQFNALHANKNAGMTIVFSTYQSIEVISAAQKELNKQNKDSCIFDLVVCDEAHRTTGVTLSGGDDSAFVKIHDNDFLIAKKRMYMTATPRLYSEENIKKAKDSDAYLCSMNDTAIYGEEVYRIGFGEAVERHLLADYKVLVLTLSEDQIPEAFQDAISDKSQEITTDDASKLIGCINALSKRMLVDAEILKESDPLNRPGIAGDHKV
jgi:predicted helicase